jgi:hypothetical protein
LHFHSSIEPRIVVITMIIFLCHFLLLSLVIRCSNGEPLIEEERIAEYKRRKYTYPLRDYVPNTTGWRDLMSQRLEQVAEMEGTGARYEAFFQTIHSAALTPNFTEYGFGLAKCPDGLLKDLRKGIYDGLETATHEAQDTVIEAPERPWYIDRPDLTQRVLQELHGFAEEWVGFPLVAHQAYGFRLYRNQSKLFMHVDRLETHVISFILHIASSDDAEPWPIFIEDFHGRTHEVILTPGDMLFYESSKCFHGRPRPFNGSWYTSVFVHYYPRDGWIDQPHDLNAHYAVPPVWSKPPPRQRRTTKLEMVETAMREPDCPDAWCRSVDTVKWSGPGEEGIWITPALERKPFHPVFKTFGDEL